jgi:hypothetical protein
VIPTTPPPTTLTAVFQPVTVNGVATTPTVIIDPAGGPPTTVVGDVLVYDQGFKSSFSSQIWGSQANWVFDGDNLDEGLQIRPLIGFRYINLRERLDQGGNYTFIDNSGPSGPVLVIADRRITSDVDNNVFGPQIGLRSELVHRWFTVGVEPKVMLGLNSYRTNVTAERILSPTEATSSTGTRKTDFGAAFELGVYGKIHVHPNFSLFVGYNLLWAGHVTRPYDNIAYDVRETTVIDNNTVPPTVTTTRSSNIHEETRFSDIVTQGLTVGGEYRFR